MGKKTESQEPPPPTDRNTEGTQLHLREDEGGRPAYYSGDDSPDYKQDKLLTVPSKGVQLNVKKATPPSEEGDTTPSNSVAHAAPDVKSTASSSRVLGMRTSELPAETTGKQRRAKKPRARKIVRRPLIKPKFKEIITQNKDKTHNKDKKHTSSLKKAANEIKTRYGRVSKKRRDPLTWLE